jgi:hypothetical protein
MKYNLIDINDNIVTSVLLEGATKRDAKRYFMKRKMFDLDESNFDKLWRVMSQEEWNVEFENGHKKQGIEWWCKRFCRVSYQKC